ncbi:MAG: hypothetical protein B5M53_02530 [Candidatus Cloacimonas sp. 4484_209]|nr:MAG: hypothetical protein B5M53_02530 [Candidatus Cloacimonas sp. 4484_209]
MEKGFWAIPKSIAKRKDLGFRAKLVAGVLWSMRDSESISYPSRKYIAKVLGISVKTVDRAIKELKEKAGLKIKRSGLGKNNRYLLADWSNFSDLSTSEKTRMTSLNKAKGSDPIVIDNGNIYTVVDDKSSSPVKSIVSYFIWKVKKTKGYFPEVNWAKEGKLVKQRLKKYSMEEIKGLIDWYLSSRHSQKLGDSLAVCLSTNMINLWKANRVSHEFYLERLYPTFGL